MPYDAEKDPHATAPAGVLSFGAKGQVVAPDDAIDLDPYPKAVVVTADGDLAVLPAKNDDGDVVTFHGVSVGFAPPYRVRRVMATGTTATVATVEE